MQNKDKIVFLGIKDFLYSFLMYGIDAVLLIYLIKVVGNTEYSSLQSLSVKSCIIYSLPILTASISNKYLSNETLSTIGLMLIGIGLILLDHNQPNKIMFSLSLLTVGYAIGRPMILIILGEITSEANNLKFVRVYYLFSNIALLVAPIIFSQILTKNNQLLFIWLGIFALTSSLIYSYFFKKNILGCNKEILKGTLTLSALILTVYLLLIYPAYLKYILLIAGLIMILQVKFLFLSKDSNYLKDLKSFMTLIATGFVFFIFFSQQYFFMPLFIEKFVSLEIYSFKIPTPWFIIINPLSGIILSPLLNKIRNQNIHNNIPFIVLFISGLSFFSLALGVKFFGYIVVSIIITYLLLALAELLLVPTILSTISIWKVKHQKSTLIGFLYLSMAFSKIFAPWLTISVGFPKFKSVQFIDSFYFNNFTTLSVMCIIAAIISKMVLKLINR